MDQGKVDQTMELRLTVQLGVVAIEKRAFASPSTTVANFPFYLYMYKPYKLTRVDTWNQPTNHNLTVYFS